MNRVAEFTGSSRKNALENSRKIFSKFLAKRKICKTIQILLSNLPNYLIYFLFLYAINIAVNIDSTLT